MRCRHNKADFQIAGSALCFMQNERGREEKTDGDKKNTIKDVCYLQATIPEAHSDPFSEII
jgi:hypothetical protein